MLHGNTSQVKLPPPTWYKPSFDDSKWKSGPSGFGYGYAENKTPLTIMWGQFTTAYLRTTFTLDQDPQGAEPMLRIAYDDGFEAYLNGERFAISKNVVRHRDGTVDLSKQHEAHGFESFPIPKRLLRKGINHLAIAGYNANKNSSDFTLEPVIEVSVPWTLEQYLADIDAFEFLLNNHASYRNLRKVDWKARMKTFRDRVKATPTYPVFMQELVKAMMLIGDCHAELKPPLPWFDPIYLPIRIADTRTGLAAMKLDSNDLLDKDYPYLKAIEGIPLETCLQSMLPFARAGSPQLIRYHTIKNAGLLGLLRELHALPPAKSVRLTLANSEKNQTKVIVMDVITHEPESPVVHMGPARVLDNKVGYFQIPEMEKELIEPTIETLRNFRDTKGLIIDVRNNKGGQQHMLRALYGVFTPAEAVPYISNIAAYRLAKDFKETHLAYRGTYRATWFGWNTAERRAISKAAKLFKPQWTPNKKEFSQWHYLVLSRVDGRRARELNEDAPDDYFYYDKPVVVLCNSKSFSATDGFLGAFSDLPHVTLIGEPSGGGSGSARRYRLPNTDTEVRLSSMASFRSNGKTFEGNGIDVDIQIQPELKDFLDDTYDSVLQRGMDFIKSQISSQR